VTCCAKPSINRMDYRIHSDEPYLVINRMCMSCGQHWHGRDGEVKEYTRAEWDKYVNEVVT